MGRRGAGFGGLGPGRERMEPLRGRFADAAQRGDADADARPARALARDRHRRPRLSGRWLLDAGDGPRGLRRRRVVGRSRRGRLRPQVPGDGDAGDRSGTARGVIRGLDELARGHPPADGRVRRHPARRWTGGARPGARPSRGVGRSDRSHRRGRLLGRRPARARPRHGAGRMRNGRRSSAPSTPPRSAHPVGADAPSLFVAVAADDPLARRLAADPGRVAGCRPAGGGALLRHAVATASA